MVVVNEFMTVTEGVMQTRRVLHENKRRKLGFQDEIKKLQQFQNKVG